MDYIAEKLGVPQRLRPTPQERMMMKQQMQQASTTTTNDADGSRKS